MSSRRWRLLARPAAVLTLAAGITTGATAAPAAAVPDYELPFACSETWTGTTRPTHRPSRLSVDFNRARDLGALTVATAPGVVLRVGDAGNRSYGKWVHLDHGDGYSSVYAHLLATWVVPGQRIDQGAVLGRVGASGGVTGAHLHFEQRFGSGVIRPTFHQLSFAYARPTASLNCPDVPLAGDWDGDRVADVAVFRRGAGGLFELRAADGSVSTIALGRGSDQPVVGDWDGDGLFEVGVRRALGRSFFLRMRDGSVVRHRMWALGDVAVTGDWDGNRVTDLGIWRPAAARFRLRQPDGTDRVVRLGNPSSQPVTGDWDADGRTDVGVFDAATATFTLLTTAADGTTTTTTTVLGTREDLPVSGDWNGDGAADLGVWSPATATYSLRLNPSPTVLLPRTQTLTFGRPRR